MTTALEENQTRLVAFAQAELGQGVAHCQPLRGGGSDRQYYRLAMGGQTLVGVVGQDLAENRAFLAFTAHFAARGIPVPRIYGVHPQGDMYLLEDLGDATLQERLTAWRALPPGPAGPAQQMEALAQVVWWLPMVQVQGGQGLDYSLCYQGDTLGGLAFRQDVQSFLQEYVGHFARQPAPSAAVLGDVEQLVTELDGLDRSHFCYRDFQTRNIMWPQHSPVFIDYQSGRRGPLAYDLVSLLYSPDTGLDEAARLSLTDTYLASLADVGVRMDREDFWNQVQRFVLVRRMQALGAYTYLARARNKPLLLEKIPATQDTLRALLAQPHFIAHLPALKTWLQRLFVQGEALEKPGLARLDSAPCAPKGKS